MKKINDSVEQFRSFLIIFGVIATLFFYIFRAQGMVYVYMTSTVTVIALILALISLWRVVSALGKGEKHTGFLLIFIGITLTVIGEILWAFFTILGNPVLAGTIPSYFFITTYFLNTIGFILIAKSTHTMVSEFLGIVVGFLLIIIILITIANASNPISINEISLGYLAGDALRVIAITLTLQMVIIYQGGLLGRYWLSIFIGNIFIIIGNFAQSVLAPKYFAAIWPYTLIDLIYLGGYVFVTHGFYGIGESIIAAQKLLTRKLSKKKK